MHLLNYGPVNDKGVLSTSKHKIHLNGKVLDIIISSMKQYNET